MPDDIIKFNTFEELKEFNDKMNQQLGYPKAGQHVGGGIQASIEPTEVHTLPIEHPIDKTFAISVDPEISKILSQEERSKIEIMNEDWYQTKDGLNQLRVISKELMIEKTATLEQEKETARLALEAEEKL